MPLWPLVRPQASSAAAPRTSQCARCTDGASQIPIAPADPGAPNSRLPSLAAFERRPGRARVKVSEGPASETRHKKRLVHRRKSDPCRRRIDGSAAVNCGVLLNDFEMTDFGAWRQMCDLLVKLAHDAEVHHGADGLDVCGLERAAKYWGNLVAIALARSQVV